MVIESLIVIAVISLMGISFLRGLYVGFRRGLADNKKKQSLQKKYCFQCEIEMPTKEKNGSLYCSNCGLRH